MRMPWEDDINWGNIATTFGKENDMVTTDKVTVAEFAPHIGKTTTDYKENDMGVYINMEKPKECDGIGINIHFTDGHMELHILDECELIEIDDTVWENEKYKLIRMTNEARFNKAMAERRADGDI